MAFAPRSFGGAGRSSGARKVRKMQISNGINTRPIVVRMIALWSLNTVRGTASTGQKIGPNSRALGKISPEFRAPVEKIPSRRGPERPALFEVKRNVKNAEC